MTDMYMQYEYYGITITQTFLFLTSILRRLLTFPQLMFSTAFSRKKKYTLSL